jgi:hypothetical protein
MEQEEYMGIHGRNRKAGSRSGGKGGKKGGKNLAIAGEGSVTASWK